MRVHDAAEGGPLGFAIGHLFQALVVLPPPFNQVHVVIVDLEQRTHLAQKDLRSEIDRALPIRGLPDASLRTILALEPLEFHVGVNAVRVLWEQTGIALLVMPLSLLGRPVLCLW